MSARQQRFIVAVKHPGGPKTPITPGKVLGQYRRQEDARRDLSKLAQRAGFGSETWRVGIFWSGKLIS